MQEYSWNCGRIFFYDLLHKILLTEKLIKFYKIKSGILLILRNNYYKYKTHITVQKSHSYESKCILNYLLNSYKKMER